MFRFAFNNECRKLPRYGGSNLKIGGTESRRNTHLLGATRQSFPVRKQMREHNVFQMKHVSYSCRFTLVSGVEPFPFLKYKQDTFGSDWHVLMSCWDQGLIKSRVGPSLGLYSVPAILNSPKNVNIFDELKYSMWALYKSVLVGMHCSRDFDILKKIFFLQFLYQFYKEKIFNLLLFRTKIYKFCQGPLGRHHILQSSCSVSFY